MALGYPPQAVDYYSKCQQLETSGKEKGLRFYDQYQVAIRYAGIRCTGHVDDLITNAMRLWGYYQDIENLEVGIDFETYPIQYNKIFID